jgi:TolA-binding protein
MKHTALTATKLRFILSFTLVLIILTTSGVLYFVNTQLRTFATEVSHTTADAAASQTTIATLQQLQQQLSENKEVVERASNIVAESQSYQYQDDIIQDLNDYASRAGITITNFNFDAAASSSEGADSPGIAPPAGINSTLVSITIQNPVVYDNLLRFIKSIEQNLTKMQVATIGLTKDTGSNITTDGLTIEVYIR